VVQGSRADKEQFQEGRLGRKMFPAFARKLGNKARESQKRRRSIEQLFASYRM